MIVNFSLMNGFGVKLSREKQRNGCSHARFAGYFYFTVVGVHDRLTQA
jgi:hypothetical protein